MAALVLGILGLTILPGIGSVLAIVVGRKNPHDSLSRVGVILGWIGLALFIVGCCAGGALSALTALQEVWREGSLSLPLAPTAPVFPTPTLSAEASGWGSGYLGMRCEDTHLQGARASEVVGGSSAEAAGLRPGDVIVRVDFERGWAEAPRGNGQADRSAG